MAVALRRTGKYGRVPILGINDIHPGQKLLVKSREWYDHNKGYDGYVECSGGMFFNISMSRLCGKTVIVDYLVDIDDLQQIDPKSIGPDIEPSKIYIQVVEEDGTKNKWCWYTDMFECILEQ